MPRLPQQVAYYPHIIILAIQLQQRNLEPLRLDSTYLYLTLVILSKRFSREPYSTSPTHAGTRVCVCVRRKWGQAQDRSRSFASIATMGMSQK